MGGYTQGQDKDLDDAILMWPKLIDFISQLVLKKQILRVQNGIIKII